MRQNFFAVKFYSASIGHSIDSR